MEKNVERLMKKTKKELVEIILRKDEETKSVGNSLTDVIDKCNDLQSRLLTITKDYKNSREEIERLRNQLSANESLVEENNKLRKYLQEANKNVAEYQEIIDSLTTDKEVIKNKLSIALKNNKILLIWSILIIILAILSLVF